MSADDRRLLRRGLIAFFLFTASEWAAWVAVLVHAFSVGGALAATVATIAQLAVAAIAAPAGAAWLSARVPEDALGHTFLLQAAAFLCTGVALGLDTPLATVVVLASIATATVTFTRPVYFSMLARIVVDDARRARVNALSTAVEGLAILAGPALAGLLLVAAGTHLVLLLCAAAQLAAMVVVWRPASMAVLPPLPRPSTPWHTTLRAGLTGLGRSRDMRTILAGVAGGFFLVGSIDVLAVVFATEALQLGPAAPGALISALGAGSVLGAGVLAWLSTGRALVAPALIAALLASVPFAMTAVSPGLQSASLWLLVAGVGKGMLDVLGRTVLPQRLGQHELAAAYGCQECIAHLALACGALLALPFVTTFGARGAFVAAAAVVPMLCLLATISARRVLAARS